MAKYYYNKYNAIASNSYSEPSWASLGRAVVSWHNYWTSYNFDPVTGQYSNAGTSWRDKTILAGNVGYMVSGSTLYRIIATKNGTVNEAEADRSTKTGAVLNQDYSRGSLVQSNIVAEDGTYPLNDRHTDGYWYVRGSLATIVPPGPFTLPATGSILESKQSLTLTFDASSSPSISTYEVDYRYNGGAWASVGTANSLTRSFTITDDKAMKKVEFRARARNTSGVYSDYVYSEPFAIQHNKAPNLELNTANNQTLYENDTLNVSGTAIDADIGNVVSVKFKVNSGNTRTIDAKVMDGSALSFSRKLTFKRGILYDGDTAITGVLEEGRPNTVAVWSEDDQGGKSAEVTRTFYVVANRPPSLTLNPIADKSGLIDKDVISISGSVSDPEGDNVTVSYRLNGGVAKQVYSGKSGNWTFDLSMKELLTGENNVVIETADSYGAKTGKTLRLTNARNAIPLKKATAMWRIDAPATTIKEVLAWIQREIGDLGIVAEISMTHAGEQENFVPMDRTESEPMNDSIIEDEYSYEDSTSKENVVLKLTLSREDTASQEAIKLISGVLE